MSQAPNKLEELVLGLLDESIFVAGADITSAESASETPLFPALRTLQFGVFEDFPMDGLLSALARNAPGLESISFSAEPEYRKDQFSPFEEPLSAEQILGFSRWGCLKSLSLPNCSVGIFATALETSPVPVLLPNLLSLEICFTQDKAVMKSLLEGVPNMEVSEAAVPGSASRWVWDLCRFL